MRKILILPFLLLFTSCSTIQDTTSSITGTVKGWFQSEEEEIEKSATQAIEDDSKSLLRNIATICTLGLALSIILGFRFKMLHELSPLFGIGVITCWLIAFLIDIIWLSMIALIIYAGIRIYLLRKKHDKNHAEHLSIRDELGRHFDDPEGESKLSDKAHNAYTLSRPERKLEKKSKDE